PCSVVWIRELAAQLPCLKRGLRAKRCAREEGAALTVHAVDERDALVRGGRLTLHAARIRAVRLTSHRASTWIGNERCGAGIEPRVLIEREEEWLEAWAASSGQRSNRCDARW